MPIRKVKLSQEASEPLLNGTLQEGRPLKCRVKLHGEASGIWHHRVIYLLTLRMWHHVAAEFQQHLQDSPVLMGPLLSSTDGLKLHQVLADKLPLDLGDSQAISVAPSLIWCPQPSNPISHCKKTKMFNNFVAGKKISKKGINLWLTWNWIRCFRVKGTR